ncbi:FmdB family zinc ribbon protein [Klenkia brasiliensis]|uniref:Putative regulatory protein, FmdB family n=1 Tax=Klenkia brasiliensis TaxID=333142 RepID=A0A1G7LUM8_9ACTN|nr:FmdB family zinc ribbon protein [Klenkia brasiliensis]SDF52669.1 putative regulatory protein, FmdB family [Klenkia brasiliensis]
MPTYQYACTNPETKHQFEVVQSFTDPAVETCPECGAPVRKVYGSVGVVFKGSGFYRTDSRDSGKKSSTSSSPAKESSSSSGSSGGDSSSSSSSSSTSATSSTSSSSSSSAPSS